MNTINQSTLETPDESDLSTENPKVEDWTINGYDGDQKKSVFKEPSLYLSIITILMATSVVLGKTPSLFWIAFIALTALAIAFHLLAERYLFRANTENKGIKAPFEGIFVVTFGAILPGLGLLAYGIYSAVTSAQSGGIADISKMVLLLVVPLFNFCVWSAVRKRYLVHPRLVGTMNGLSLGLSVSWTIVWLKLMFLSSGDPSIKLGWMLLLFSAPFLLFAATCLSFDLWRKTESRIRKITTTFSVLGGVLSMLFVFTPIARSCYVQSLVSQAKSGTSTEKQSVVSLLRSIMTPEDLRPSKSPISGFSLGTLLLPDRGLDGGTDADKDAFFRITGKPFTAGTSDSEEQQSVNVGDKVAGLFLSKSQLTGSINAATLSSSVDWLFNFHNASTSTQEVRAEISLPKGAVVSRATLWVNGEPKEAAFAPTAKTREAYDAVVRKQRDPLLVTMPTADKVLIQCYPVPAGGGKVKVLLGFKIPLEITSSNACSLQMPILRNTNFAQPKRHRVSLQTTDTPLGNTPGIVLQKAANGYTMHGFVKTEQEDQSKTSLLVQRPATAQSIAVLDWRSSKQNYIVQRINAVTTPAPKRLFVVVDQSETLKGDSGEITKALSTLPKQLTPTVFLSAESNTETPNTNNRSSMTWKEAQEALKATSFVGGQDNLPVLRDALELAAEQPDSAVLWIHGVQPLTQNLAESVPLDLVHSVRLYDLQIGAGTNATLESIRTEDASRQVRHETLEKGSIAERIAALSSKWQSGEKRLIVERTVSGIRPQLPVVTDRSISDQVACLWANDEVSRLSAADQEGTAIALATKYRLVTSITGAVVLESARDYVQYNLNPAAFNTAVPPASYSMSYKGGGLYGSPVDPRYGQSNEVGSLADFGYDTARDISRVVTALSFLLAFAVAGFFLKSARERTGARIGKAVILVITTPTIVHIVGTFMINNFGGLGGGL